MTTIAAPHDTTYQAPKYATPEQVKYLRDLLTKHQLFTGDFDRLWKILENHELSVRHPGDGTRFPRNQANDTIGWLLSYIERHGLKPVSAGSKDQAALPGMPIAAPKAGIPAGRYAVASLTGSNDLDFFKVDRPTEGKWAGRTFVNRVIGGHPDFPVRGSEARKVLAAIAAAGVTESMKKFGQELGECGRCGRTLTDEVSRARGIGPTCWGLASGEE